MAKAQGFDDPSLEIPAAWEALMEKILRWFDNQQYPVWAPFNLHSTRSAKKANKERTYLVSVASEWGLLDAATKAQWATAADFGTLNNYQLFTSDYSYRRKNNLSLPGTPNAFHQLMGISWQNPDPLATCRLRRDCKDLEGQVTIAFNYEKTEYNPTTDKPFSFLATLYYFEDGLNKTETHEWSAGAGNKAWQAVSETFGTAGRKYFHLTILWYLDGYDAKINIDRLLVSDVNGDIYRECWQFKAGKTWEYDNLYRKEGWLFTPQYHVPYFEVAYLG